MPTSRRTLLKTSAAAAAAFSFDWTRAQAQAETVRIGLIYDLTGPFAAGGSVASSIGTQIAIDLVNEKGGVGGKYKVSPVAVNSQSKPDVAINEANRLIDQEKIDILNGVFASSHAVPLAAKVEQQKKILWITTAVSTAVFKDKNLQYVFRAQIHSDQYGQAFAGFIAEHAKAKLGMEPKDVKVALIHEDGPYGVGVAAADEAYAKEAGLQIVLREGYSASAPDLSVLVTKLKRARPMSSRTPDTTPISPCSCVRRARTASSSRCCSAPARAIASSTSCGRPSRADIDNFCNIDPVPAQLLDASKLAPGVGELTKIMVDALQGRKPARPTCRRTVRWDSTRPGSCSTTCCPSPRTNTAASIPKPFARRRSTSTSRRAAPSRATASNSIGPARRCSGQNERSTPVVMQNAGEHISVVWPTNIRTQDPVFPLPKSSVYAV